MRTRREEWTFYYRSDEVAAGAQAKADHHRERADWWEQELEDREKELREKGIELRERQQTGGPRLEAVLDPELQNRVNECRTKRNAHREREREFQVYADVLRPGQHDMTLELTVADIKYFGLTEADYDDADASDVLG